MEALYYVLFILVIGGVGFGGIWIKRKFNIKEEEAVLLELILEIVGYITANFEFKVKEGLSKIVLYCLAAITFVEKFEQINDLEIKLELIKDKALDICEERDIYLDDGIVVELIDRIVEYLFRHQLG